VATLTPGVALETSDLSNPYASLTRIARTLLLQRNNSQPVRIVTRLKLWQLAGRKCLNFGCDRLRAIDFSAVDVGSKNGTGHSDSPRAQPNHDTHPRGDFVM
jgi:hypothetical protein